MAGRTRGRHSPLAEYLRETGHVVRYAEAIERFGHYDLRTALRDGKIMRVLPDAYAHVSRTRDPETKTAAGSLWSAPEGALSGSASLWAWGILKSAPSRPTVQLPQALHLEHPPWLRVVRPGLPPQVELRNGLRVVPVSDALVQAWNDSSGLSGTGLVLAAFGREATTASDLSEALARRARVRARREFAALLGHLDGGVTSWLEHRARTIVFPRDSFPELRWQAPIRVGTTERVLDAWDPESKVALEFDGAEFHSGDAARLADITRDAELATLGITVLRLPYRAVVERPDWCRQTYRAARRTRVA